MKKKVNKNKKLKKRIKNIVKRKTKKGGRTISRRQKVKSKTGGVMSRKKKIPGKKVWANKEVVKAKKPILKKAKPKKTPRVATGISGFDKLIQGGLDYGSINLVVGGSGSGKTIFAMQFLMQGIKKGETALYITFEESKQEFYENMLKFGWDLAKLESAGKFIFLEYSPEKVKMMLDEGGGAIESTVIKQKVKRMVIDSISSFSLLFESEQEKRHSILELFDIIRKWDNTALLTLEKDPLESKEETETAVENHADSIILLYFVKLKEERERFIEVLKMRGTKHSTETYKLEIKKGLAVGKKTKLKLGCD